MCVNASVPELRDPRESVFLMAELLLAGADPVRCRVTNLSTRGVCLAQVPQLSPNAKVRISIGSIIGVAADVMWARDPLAGLRFDYAINLVEARQRKRLHVPPPSAGWTVDIKNAYRK